MSKIRFKGNYKKVERFGEDDKVTLVTLTGRLLIYYYEQCKKGHNMGLPWFIGRWASTHKGVEVIEDYSSGEYIITAIGKTIRHDSDKDSPVYAERIAEAKAKIKIYKFAKTYYKMLLECYLDHAFGGEPIKINVNPKRHSLMQYYLKYCMLYDKEVTHLNCLLKL